MAKSNKERVKVSAPVGRLTSVSAHKRRKPTKRPKRIRHPRPDGSPRVIEVKAHRRHVGAGPRRDMEAVASFASKGLSSKKPANYKGKGKGKGKGKVKTLGATSLSLFG